MLLVKFENRDLETRKYCEGKIEPILIMFDKASSWPVSPNFTSYGAQNRQKVDKFGFSLSVCISTKASKYMHLSNDILPRRKG